MLITQRPRHLFCPADLLAVVLFPQPIRDLSPAMPPAELLGNLSVDPVSAGVLPIWPVFRGPVLRNDTNLPNVRL